MYYSGEFLGQQVVHKKLVFFDQLADLARQHGFTGLNPIHGAHSSRLGKKHPHKGSHAPHPGARGKHYAAHTEHRRSGWPHPHTGSPIHGRSPTSRASLFRHHNPEMLGRMHVNPGPHHLHESRLGTNLGY